TNVFWGAFGLYRVGAAANDAGVEVLGQTFNGGNDNAPESVAVDSTKVYGATNGIAVISCPKGAVCTTDGGTIVAYVGDAGSNGPRGVASDDTSVYVTAGSTGDESVLVCPVAGCPAQTPVTFAHTAGANGSGTHYGIVVDAKYVYW